MPWNELEQGAHSPSPSIRTPFHWGAPQRPSTGPLPRTTSPPCPPGLPSLAGHPPTHAVPHALCFAPGPPAASVPSGAQPHSAGGDRPAPARYPVRSDSSPCTCHQSPSFLMTQAWLCSLQAPARLRDMGTAPSSQGTWEGGPGAGTFRDAFPLSPEPEIREPGVHCGQASCSGGSGKGRFPPLPASGGSRVPQLPTTFPRPSSRGFSPLRV